ncbi:MAG: hypothetical protein KKH04_15770 [Proteobacteria bacterium]|nr:hypothetical protein [Pseudomonadota bacterium]
MFAEKQGMPGLPAERETHLFLRFCELLLLPTPPFYMVTAVGKYGSKRYGVRVEKGEIRME